MTQSDLRWASFFVALLALHLVAAALRESAAGNPFLSTFFIIGSIGIASLSVKLWKGR